MLRTQNLVRFIAAAALFAVVLPARAGAGTYGVRACDGALGGANLSWSASSTGTVAAYAGACPTGYLWDRGIVTRPVYSGHNDVGLGVLQFDAPAGTAVVGLDINGCYLVGAGAWTVALQTPGVVVASARPTGGCGQRHWDVPAAPYVQWILRCDDAVHGCPDDTETGVRMRAVTVTIEDDGPPTIANVHGVWGDGGWRKELGSVFFDAGDASGISRAELLVDGQLASTDDQWVGPCDERLPRPCGDLAGGAFRVHDDDVDDGRHTLTLRLWDAAGNVSSLESPLLIDRHAPAAPVEVTETIPENGAWSQENDFSLRLTKPAEEHSAPITQAAVKVCPSDPQAVCQTQWQAYPIASDQQTVTLTGIKAPAPGDWTARIWLKDAAGNESAGAFDHSVRIRFDPDPPSLGINGVNPRDPATLTARAKDAASGVAEGQIELSAHGTNDWRSIPTAVDPDELVAKVDDGSLPRGIYDERVWAKDAAGNVAVQTAASAISIPLRVGTQIRAGLVVRRAARKGRRNRDHVHLVAARRVHYGNYADAQGVVVSRDGEPLADAQVTVSATPAITGAKPQVVGVVTTDAHGAFTYRARARQSRDMTFAYSGSALRLPGAATVHLRVPATSTIHVNRRHVFNGDTVTFSGRLRGGNIPAGGKLVILEAWVRGMWQPIAQMRADAGGRWRAQHTFTTVAGKATFRFRLSIPHDNLYPFASGNSARINVVVEGL